MFCCLDGTGTIDCRIYSNTTNGNGNKLQTDDITVDDLELCYYAELGGRF